MTARDAPRFVKPVTHDPAAPILDVSHATVRYDGRLALDDVSFFLTVGERVAVVGPNGAGKSTLFKAIAGVLALTQGDIRVAGHDPDSHICIAYVPQRSQVDWSFPVTVADVVMMGRAGKIGLLRRPGQKDWKYVQAVPGGGGPARSGRSADRRAVRRAAAAHVYRPRAGPGGAVDADGRAADRAGRPRAGGDLSTS